MDWIQQISFLPIKSGYIWKPVFHKYSLVCLGLILFIAQPGNAMDVHHEIRVVSGSPAYDLTPTGWDTVSLRTTISEVNPSESLEAIFFLPWATPAPQNPKDQQTLIKLALRRISHMSGLRYHADSQKAGEVLYKEVSVVVSPENLSPLPDPLPEEIDGSIDLFIRTLNDADNEAVLNIRATDGEKIIVELKNATPVKFLFITVVDTADLRFVFHLFPEPRGVRIYGVGAINTFRIGFVRKFVQQQLVDITHAIISWLDDGITSELAIW